MKEKFPITKEMKEIIDEFGELKVLPTKKTTEKEREKAKKDFMKQFKTEEFKNLVVKAYRETYLKYLKQKN